MGLLLAARDNPEDFFIFAEHKRVRRITRA
jgi:hypothetical protein